MADDALIGMDRRLHTGRAYLAALAELGFAIDRAFWTLAPADGRYELAIVSPWVDRIGPTRLYALLFAAHEAHATPGDIDPFEISLYSPRMALPMVVERVLAAEGSDAVRLDDTGLTTCRDWVLVDGCEAGSGGASFSVFQARVERLAA